MRAVEPSDVNASFKQGFQGIGVGGCGTDGGDDFGSTGLHAAKLSPIGEVARNPRTNAGTTVWYEASRCRPKSRRKLVRVQRGPATNGSSLCTMPLGNWEGAEDTGPKPRPAAMPEQNPRVRVVSLSPPLIMCSRNTTMTTKMMILPSRVRSRWAVMPGRGHGS